MKQPEKITGQAFDKERAFYGRCGIVLSDCRFDGPADGESALKECTDVAVQNCFCNLRYPFWHDHYITIENTELTPLCRAALWYSDHISVSDSRLHGIKALRECRDAALTGCDIVSPEFGWSVRNLRMEDCTAESEYFLMRSEQVFCSGLELRGKYSFQYVRGAELENCVLNTKDAFWHSENVTVRNSVVNGEYLAWYSDHLTLINCRITGTQPLCYCTNLRLINCELTGADLCFEKSEVEATLTAPVDSIKNPLRGTIAVPQLGELIRDDPASRGEVIVNGERAFR